MKGGITMNIDNIQNWTIDDALAVYEIGFAVIYHNGRVTLEWEAEWV